MRQIKAAAALAVGFATGVSAGSEPTDFLPPLIPAKGFERFHQMIRPSADEMASFWELPWEVFVQAAREKAAAQDKPILAYFGANGNVLFSGTRR